MMRVEYINEQLDKWLVEEAAVQNRLDYIHSQIDRLLGEKTLKLVGGTDVTYLHDRDEDNPTAG